MAKRNNNVGATVSSTNENDRKFAKVDSVLIKNNATRKEMLKRVYWKDRQYTDFAGVDYVRDIDLSDKDVKPITNGKELIDYTLDNKNEYSKEILKKNFSNEVNHRIYEMRQIPNDELWKWYGNYFENNSWDSKLFKIGQIKLSEGEIRTKIANDNRFLEQKYITPRLLNFYGNKIDTQYGIMQYTLGNHFDGIINVGTGRMGDIAEADALVIDDYDEIIRYPERFTGAGFDYLQEQIQNSNNKRYVEFVTLDNDEDALNYYPNIQRGRGIIDNYNRDFSQQTFSEKGYTTYDEKDSANNNNERHSIESDGDDVYHSPKMQEKSLLSKTARMFNEHKIATMVGRFHVTVDKSATTIDTAISKYGNSHGRNLLTKEAEKGNKGNNEHGYGNGYDNPYCRVWTYHHQYRKVSDLIRPFESGVEPRSKNPYTAVYPNSSASDGSTYLKNNTVLGENGFVKIAPKSKDGCGNEQVKIKQCMFSIENLAWKDVPKGGDNGVLYISDEQRGPNGGRIMWFPPYDLDFQENVSVNWNQSTFIGRGEPVFTYSNTNRTGTLSFCVLVDHPSIIDNIGKNNVKTSEDNENDILRFFAGCNLPEELDKVGDCDSKNNVENNSSNDDEPKQVTNLKKCQRIRFYVYFPNNYSGYELPCEKGTYAESGPSDRTWFDYLLMGKDVVIPSEDFNEQIGYEILKEDEGGSNHGISTSDACSHSELGTFVNEKTVSWQLGTGITDGVWYTYKVDFDSHQKLKNVDIKGNSRGMVYEKTNYADSKSFGLNRSFVKRNNGGKETILQTDATHTFAEVIGRMYVANRRKMDDNGIFGNYRFINEVTNISSNDVLLNIFNGNKYDSVVSVEINGCATIQDSKNSDKLALRRAEAIKNLLKRYIPEKENLYKIGEYPAEKLYDKTDDNTLQAKLRRCAVVDIYYDAPEISSVSERQNNTNYENTSDNRKQSSTKPYDSKFATATTNVINGSRYENEADYFKELSKESPLIYKSLIEKFKYFNPAFHSISPEGFNARLTFLHQCTRQGHTIEASNVNGFAKTAGNLSFGRMPVCILRLGDFLNTRILINGFSVSYGSSGTMQWDLNPEGIGVQPMYAKVSLQITILGGQSLEGPISRLQNAVTFNYYANTGVYDNRSDRISITEGYTTETNESEKVRYTKEQGGKTYVTTDESQYHHTDVKYTNIFTPYPKLKDTEIKDDKKKK